MASRRVFITVAEVSGDRHAAQLVTALRSLDPDLIIEGLGGREMAAAGATIHSETVGNAGMGVSGALRAFEVLRLLRRTRDHFKANRPDLLVGVDSPSMNFHFAKLAKSLGIPVLQYVAPQLWAWREGRMKKVRRWIDRLACILPFEEDYFKSHGVNATFVGHPLFDELPPHRDLPRPRFPDRAPVIGLLPGSRKSEAAANFPGLLGGAELIRAEFPASTFLIPTTPATDPVVSAALGRSPALSGIEHRVDAFDEVVPNCDLCLTVSGTATLHVAGFGVPMIVVYATKPLLWHGLGRWLINATTYALVNVLAVGPRARNDQHLVPELIPWFGDPGVVADCALDFLRHPEKLAAQGASLDALVRSLDHPGASMNVARIALDMLDSSANRARPVSLQRPGCP